MNILDNFVASYGNISSEENDYILWIKVEREIRFARLHQIAKSNV